jgi:UDP-GlcNAc:undecaprenyl-phosphate GlcNAc-1-phosphate transferase
MWFLVSGGTSAERAVVGTSVGLLVLGIIDDKFTLSATAKLVGSLVAAAALVFMLSQSATHAPSAPLVVVAVIWFGVVVHAVNLLDNIDGLAAGVGAIAALGLALVMLASDSAGAALLFTLAAALVGFLPWNTHPARLFMGDGGSLFVGSILAGASLGPWFGTVRWNPFWALAIVLTLIVPLGEASFVTVLRWMAGRTPMRGGIDHTSHRLVALGFSQRRTVMFLYAVELAAASTAVWLARSGAAALPVAALLLVGVGLGAVYLARVPTYQGEDFAALQRIPFGTFLRTRLARSHAAQVLLDLVLIAASYYAAYRLRFEGEALEIFLPPFAASLPIVILCKLVAHFASGLYRRSWHTFGVTDIAPVVRAIVAGSTASVLAATYLFRFERFSRGVFVIDAVLLLLAVLGTRLSFRLMAHAAAIQGSQSKRVLICGARERGQLLAREMLLNTAWGLKPVGFVDSSRPSADAMLGVRVYEADDWPTLIRHLRVDELVFSGDPMDAAHRQSAFQVCAELGVPVRELIFEIREPQVGNSGTSAA